MVLKRYGLDAVPAPTNAIPERLRAVEKRFLESRGRHPAILIDAGGCPQLVKALLYGYRYKRKVSGDLSPLPDKNEASHPVDALQYLCLGVNSNYVGRRINLEISRSVGQHAPQKPKFSAAAWT